MDDLELGAKHAGLAGSVDRPQSEFPEAAASWEQAGSRERDPACPRPSGAIRVPPSWRSISPLTPSSVDLQVGDLSGFLRSITCAHD